MNNTYIKSLIGQTIGSITMGEHGDAVFRNVAGEYMFGTTIEMDIYDELGMRFDTSGVE